MQGFAHPTATFVTEIVSWPLPRVIYAAITVQTIPPILLMEGGGGVPLILTASNPSNKGGG